MRTIFRALLVLLLTVQVAQAAPATPETQQPGVLASTLPSEQSLGNDWHLRMIYKPEIASDPRFVDAVSATYVGPDGQRASLTLLESAVGRQALYDAWTETQTWFDSFISLWGFIVEDSRLTEYADLPLPVGTSDAVRTDGTTRLYDIPVCIGGYAIDPVYTVDIVVEGEIDDLRGEVNSCDALASVIAATLQIE